MKTILRILSVLYFAAAMLFIWSAHDKTGAVLLSVVVPILFCLYMLPSIIAFRRGHTQRWTIFVANVFLGDTVVAWFALLALAQM